MALKEKIQGDLNKAVLGKDELKSSVFRLLLAVILNKEKEKRYKLKEEKDVQLTDEEIINVISSEIKKRREAAELYEKGQRQELADKEKKEVKVLEAYLPEQMPEEELKKIVKEAVLKVGAKTQKDMGRVMAELMPKIKGRADSSLISKAVKELLA